MRKTGAMGMPEGRRGPSVGLVALSVALALALLSVLAAAGPDAADAKGKHKGGKQKRPNIVFVVSDDQTRQTFTPKAMPELFKKVVKPGVRFDDFIVPTPSCCPFRAAMLTGEYGHNNGVLDSAPGYDDLLRKRDVLPAWLQASGYRTAHFGHYLNGYPRDGRSVKDPAPGWSYWQNTAGHTYYDYAEGLNGKTRRHGTERSDHITAVTNKRAKQFVRQKASGRRPLYLQIDQLAPHSEYGRPSDGECSGLAVPEERDRGLLDGAPTPRGPAFDEADVSDKPSHIRDRRPMSGPTLAKIEQAQKCEFAAMRGIDRGIGELVEQFKKAGELNRTAFIYTTDNGAFHGEHRISQGKVLPYEEAIRVPLAMRLPGKRGDKRVGSSAAAVDLAPTVLELAGDVKSCRGKRRREVCRTMDGRSLVPLARKGDGARTSEDGGLWPAHRAIPLEYDQTINGGYSSCEYHGVRTAGSVWVEHVSVADVHGSPCRPASEIEMYDLGADPFQLRNLWPAAGGSADASRAAALQRKAGRLESCAGIKGRDRRAGGGRSFCE